MHQLESYSRATGLRIEKMHLTEHFYPIPFDNKYIVIVASTGSPCRNYPHYRIALNLIRPYLEERGIKVIQCGGKDDVRIGADLDLCGRTSLYQYCWLIKNSELVICGDTSALHIAGHYDKNIVTLFSISDPKVSGAYYGNKNKQVYLTPPTFKPNYSLDDSNTSIQEILPELVGNNALRLLGFENYVLPATKHIGDAFGHHVLESIPNVVVRADFLQGHPLNVRLDKGGTEQIAIEQLKHRKTTLITNKPVNLQALHALRGNLDKLVYVIDENEDVRFAEALYRNAIPHQLVSFLPEEKLQEIKLKYVDLSFIHRSDKLTKPEGISEKAQFISNKRILSDGKVYLSHAHARLNRPLDKFANKQDNILDEPDFWEDLDFLYIFE